jgi:uncharacterized protein
MKTLLVTALVVALLYIMICALAYFYQEKLIFFPSKLSDNFSFHFSRQPEEIFIRTKDATNLHGLLFKSDSSKGLIFYLHGNGGALDSWGTVADVYTELQYDVFLLDYRGYGKSEGAIYSQSQFYDDVQRAYDQMRSRYPEEKITVLGYSVGTGAASMLAARNKPQRLILQAPYYSLADMTKRLYSYVPVFLLKYKFENNVFLPTIKCPITIFHGDEDEVIYYGSSVKLSKLLKPGDEFITLTGEGHNGISDNLIYRRTLQRLLR